jgi:glycosyltransferase involved in cell wall biosynthesis
LLISIVMPCFNVAETVARTLTSVCNQTFTDFELLAIDDGSSDNTVEVVQDYARQFMRSPARLRVLSQGNRGAGAARNLGMCQARGDLIAFLDADDLWNSEYLATVAAVFQRYPQLEALASNSWDVCPHGYHLNVNPKNDAVLIVEDLFKALLDGSVVVRTSGVTVRSTIPPRVGHMRVDLLRGQDYEYWSRLAASGVCWGFSPKPLMFYDGIRIESQTRNQSRFANAPSPETWSRDIWPLLDYSTMRGSFQKWYIHYARSECWEQLQAGLDDRARATANEAFPRTTGCRNTLALLAVRFVPGWIHRLVWRAGSRVKRLLRSARRGLGATHEEHDLSDLP